MLVAGLSVTFLAFGNASADTLEFRNDAVLKGVFVAGTTGTVSFDSEGEVKIIHARI